MCCINRLLKNAHLLRCAHHASLRRTKQYASLRLISRALHLSIFKQPVYIDFLNNPLKLKKGASVAAAGPERGLFFTAFFSRLFLLLAFIFIFFLLGR